MKKQKTNENFLIPVQGLLSRVEETMREQSIGYHPDIVIALQQILSSGGKRIRPALALLTGGMLSGDVDRLVILSAAIELLHTATLVHDDLIDGSLLRRGNTTLNAKWSPAATVLTGDFVFARAAKLAANTYSVEVMRLFAETLTMIVDGELSQLLTSRGVANQLEYEQRIYAKTASLFELATTAAALLSPVQSSVVDKMREFGYSIGMAFQIMDDVIDFTGDQPTVGKPVASDLRQGLITLPALFFLEAFPNNPEMLTLINGGVVSDLDFESLVSSIRSSNAIRQSLQEAQRYIQLSLNLLSAMPENPEREALEDLASYIVRREL